MIAVPSVEDFRPPYHLGAFGCALVGAWSGPPALPSTDVRDLAGFEPLRWRGRYLGVALVLRYDRPSAEYPVAYSEIILSYVVRRFTEWAALPFDLVLDNPFFVEAGRHHYHLPKRLDESLRIDVERDARGAPSRIMASGVDIDFDARLKATAVPCERGIVSTLVRGFTSHIPVIGASEAPLLRALIRVAPDPETASSPARAPLVVGAQTLTPLSGMFWETLAITVGVPSPAAR